MARRVLLADSDVDALGELAAALRVRGFTVLLASDAEAALERARSDAPDIVLAAASLAEEEDLIGKQVIAVVNFPPKQIGKFMSEVLTLGIPDEKGQVILLEPTLKVPNGGRLF